MGGVWMCGSGIRFDHKCIVKFLEYYSIVCISGTNTCKQWLHISTPNITNVSSKCSLICGKLLFARSLFITCYHAGDKYTSIGDTDNNFDCETLATLQTTCQYPNITLNPNNKYTLKHVVMLLTMMSVIFLLESDKIKHNH